MALDPFVCAFLSRGVVADEGTVYGHRSVNVSKSRHTTLPLPRMSLFQTQTHAAKRWSQILA
eukprot:1592228-Amphidinium_carterae.1